MEKILDLLKDNFEITPKYADILQQIRNQLADNYKDEFICENLVKYRLDINSVIAYLISANKLDVKVDDEDILHLVSLLSDWNFSEEYNSEVNESEMLRKQIIAMSKDIRVVIIKLCIVLYEATNCENQELTQSKKNFLKYVKEIYAPLAERLGLNKLKSNLEDISLKLLNPDIYKELESNVLLKKEENLKQIELTKTKIQKILDELNLKTAQISARQKHFSSIYKKLITKNVPLAKIYDLIAMRVIVEKVEDCYAVLGKIHSIYKPMEGRFKDYIANPKPNGYQSLHTTIIVDNQRPMEIQIRTFAMHKNAEYGVDVAHWIYKEKRKKNELDKKLSWLREIMDSSENMSSEEFVETLKTDLIADKIFVQTPKGKVIELPEGSSLIDFAYTIHSDIGNTCVGGKVNNKMVPITTKLSNNDIVEILTNPNSKGPSRDWLNNIKTSGARSKINAFFKKELKEENIKNGRTMLNLAVKSKGLAPNKVVDDKYLSKLLNRYAFNTINELLAAVGYGSITVNQVVNRLISEYSEDNIENQITKTNNTLQIRRNKDGVLVDGDDGMLVRYAKCCNPVQGEDIIGYISRGRGVTIHSKNCPNINDFEKERIINAEWSDDLVEKIKVVNIKVICNMTEDIIFRLTQKLSLQKYYIVAFDSKNSLDKIVITLKIKIEQNQDETLLIDTIKQLQDVQEVFII